MDLISVYNPEKILDLFFLHKEYKEALSWYLS